MKWKGNWDRKCLKYAGFFVNNTVIFSMSSPLQQLIACRLVCNSLCAFLTLDFSRVEATGLVLLLKYRKVLTWRLRPRKEKQRWKVQTWKLELLRYLKQTFVTFWWAFGKTASTFTTNDCISFAGSFLSTQRDWHKNTFFPWSLQINSYPTKTNCAYLCPRKSLCDSKRSLSNHRPFKRWKHSLPLRGGEDVNEPC